MSALSSLDAGRGGFESTIRAGRGGLKSAADRPNLLKQVAGGASAGNRLEPVLSGSGGIHPAAGSALRRLERGGYAFELTPGGSIAFHYAWPDEPPAAWADPLLARLGGEDRAAAVAVLRAREEWLAAYDEWSAVLAQGGDDPLRDEMYWRNLVMLATQAEWPCYDGAGRDLGAAGWQRLLEQQIQPFNKEESDTMGIKIEQTTYDVVPTGEYRAVISDISAADGKFGPQLQIKSTINAGPYAGNTFLCWVSTKFSPKSKLYEWVEAALGSVAKTYTFDSDDLIGREVTATLVVRELESGGEVNRVDRVKGI